MWAAAVAAVAVLGVVAALLAVGRTGPGPDRAGDAGSGPDVAPTADGLPGRDGAVAFLEGILDDVEFYVGEWETERVFSYDAVRYGPTLHEDADASGPGTFAHPQAALGVLPAGVPATAAREVSVALDGPGDRLVLTTPFAAGCVVADATFAADGSVTATFPAVEMAVPSCEAATVAAEVGIVGVAPAGDGFEVALRREGDGSVVAVVPELVGTRELEVACATDGDGVRVTSEPAAVVALPGAQDSVFVLCDVIVHQVTGRSWRSASAQLTH